jgi:hypothetical protein
LVRHSVTVTVKMMYTTSAAMVIQANQASNLTARMVSTSATSISVGTMLYSEYEISDSMPRTPRSMSRVMPPVWRSR